MEGFNDVDLVTPNSVEREKEGDTNHRTLWKALTILKLLPRRILNSDGGIVLHCLLVGVLDSKYKVKIVDIVLNVMRKESTSITHCADVICRLRLELQKLPVEHLVRWCNDCVQSVVQDNDVNLIWGDILPECMHAISSHSTVKHCGSDMSSAEYKQQIVHALCQSKWTEKQTTQLVAMFTDMQLSRDDHKQVVNKICSYIVDFPPDSLPPLVHQLVKLCKLYHIEIVLTHLSHYFNVRLYSKLEPPPQDSESTTMDIDDIVQHNPAELSRCLSTCIYHITQRSADPELIRKHLKNWPKTQLLQNLFLLDLALAVSDKGADFRTVCLDIIRSAIELRITQEQRSNESAWVRSVSAPLTDVATVLKVLTTESANHRELTVVGLINLAFSLLHVFRTKPTAQECWSLGKLILVRLCKAQPETAGHILSQLADRLAGDADKRQYSECLHMLCKLTPLSVERCTQLRTILENTQPSPGEYKSAARVLDAVHPLINYSTRTRDSLVMVCRKGLYSRDSAHRCLALSGFLTVLRHMKLSRTTVSTSQSVCSDQFSAHSYLTQLTIDFHATQEGATVKSRVRNEAVCMEVVSILRRCLLQDSAVKQLLYTKLYDCAKEKTILHEPILEMLYEHLSKYLPENQEGSPLLIDKCVQVTPLTAILVEPISHLLYLIIQFLQPEEEELEDILGSQSVETASAHLKSRLCEILDAVTNSDTFGNFDLEDPGLSDLTPESKAKSLQLQQTISCYETLIAHQLLQWTPHSERAATMYKLFAACNKLLERTKTPSKIGKKGSKLSLNDTKETAKSQKSQKSQKEKGKPALKVSNLVKDRAGPFRPLPCLWDLRLCLRLLELLYSENVPWSSTAQRNDLRSKRDFHHYALRNIRSVLAGDIDKRTLVTYVPSVANIMYKRCLCRYQDISEFDEQTTLNCIEVLRDCLALLFSQQYSLKMDVFLIKITGVKDAQPAEHIAAILEQIHAAFIQIEEESVPEDRDLMIKKMCVALIQLASVLLEVPVHPSAEMSNVITKLEDYVRTSKQDCLQLLPSLLAASYRGQTEAQFVDDLLTQLSRVLGRIDEEDTSAGEESSSFKSIDDRSGHTILTHVCTHLMQRLKCTDHLVARVRDLSAAIGYTCAGQQHRIDKELKEIYKGIVTQLSQLSAWVCAIGKLRCSIGQGSDKVLNLCVRLYTVLSGLAKQIDGEMTQFVRLERLLKLCGKKYSSVCDNLITYLEASMSQQTASKVLRDTKLIPRLVFEAEQFTKHVVMLDNKAKLNYQQYLSLGTARDFRINAPVLQQVLSARYVQHDENEETINEAETEVMSGNSDSDRENDENETNKRRRTREPTRAGKKKSRTANDMSVIVEDD